MDSDQTKQVVAVRLAGFELYALDQLAALNGANRTETVRTAIVSMMRQTMLDHPDWPMHPAWAKAGTEWGQDNHERWVVSMFQRWAHCITADDPSVYLQEITMDGVTAYRFREGAPTVKMGYWADDIERYRARKAQENQG